MAAALYGVGQTAWYVQLGKTRDLPLLVLFLAAAAYCAVRLFLGFGGEADLRRRRAGRIVALLYTAAQGIVLLLTAEAGFGLAALVLQVGIYLLCTGVLTGGVLPRRN